MLLKSSVPVILATLALVAASACGVSAAPPAEPPHLPVTVSDVRLIHPTAGPTPTPYLVVTPVTEKAVPPGEGVFGERCAVCHGRAGEGGIGPALNTDDFAQKFSADNDLVDVLRNGADGMPGFDNRRITDQDMKGLVTYIRSLVEELNP